MSANAIRRVGLIRELRRSRDMSQQRLAELAKCSVSMIRLIEGGYEPEGSDVLARVVQVLLKDGE